MATAPFDKEVFARSLMQREPTSGMDQPPPNPAAAPLAAPPGGQGEPGDGTKLSGYATPDLGPFECENCTHFNEQLPKSCDHPEVIADPEVEKVEAEGCCNNFKSSHSQTQGEEHTEGEGAGGEEPEGEPPGAEGAENES